MKKSITISILLLVLLAFCQSTFWRNEALKASPLAIASLGLTDEIQYSNKFGNATDITGTADIWNGFTEQSLYVFPDSLGEYLNVYAVDAVDSGLVIRIQGLDVEGYAKDTVMTLGADSVTTPSRWRAVNRAFNANGAEFQDVVKIIGRFSGNIFAYIDPLDQQTTQMPFMVPVDKVCIITRVATAINKAASADAGAFVFIKTRFPRKVFRTRVKYGVQKQGTSTYSSPMGINAVLPPLTQVRVIATVTAVCGIAQNLDLVYYSSSIYTPAAIDRLLNN